MCACVHGCDFGGCEWIYMIKGRQEVRHILSKVEGTRANIQDVGVGWSVQYTTMFSKVPDARASLQGKVSVSSKPLEIGFLDHLKMSLANLKWPREHALKAGGCCLCACVHGCVYGGCEWMYMIKGRQEVRHMLVRIQGAGANTRDELSNPAKPLLREFLDHLKMPFANSKRPREHAMEAGGCCLCACVHGCEWIYMNTMLSCQMSASKLNCPKLVDLHEHHIELSDVSIQVELSQIIKVCPVHS